ncbi:MAG: AlpA family phage regulatory protein [Betaproteobacteria bacterium]|nr:AlpA family phage regulatory protein [Betaproteobacteria bacterium]
MPQQQAPQALRFLRLCEVAHKTGMGKSTVLAWESLGRFPQAVRLSPTLRVWLESDIDKWMVEKHAKVAAGSHS